MEKSHLPDEYKATLEEESRIQKRKEQLRTLILLTGESVLYGDTCNLSVKHTTADRFDSKTFRKQHPNLDKQYRMNVNSTTINIHKM